MLGKIVLCTVFIVFVSQVCCDDLTETNQITDIIEYDEPKVIDCSGSWKNIVDSSRALANDFALVYIQIFVAMIETTKCANSSEIDKCVTNVFKNSVEGFKFAVSDFGTNFVSVANSVEVGIKSCVLKKTSEGFQLRGNGNVYNIINSHVNVCYCDGRCKTIKKAQDY